jgi:hypothetical protein
MARTEKNSISELLEHQLAEAVKRTTTLLRFSNSFPAAAGIFDRHKSKTN